MEMAMAVLVDCPVFRYAKMQPRWLCDRMIYL